jgi:hypothetical protein
MVMVRPLHRGARMNLPRPKIALLSIFCLSLFGQSGLAKPPTRQIQRGRSQSCHHLTHGRILSRQPLNDSGSNTGKQLLTLEKLGLAIAKPPSQITMLGIARGSEPVREVLAFRGGQRLFGKTFDVIPRTDFRLIDRVRHSVQRWIVKAVAPSSVVSIVTETLPFGKVRFTDYSKRIPKEVLRKLDVDSVHMLAILDYVINQPDRRPDNWMLEKKSGRLYLRGIDNGVSWVLDHNLPTGWRRANDSNYFAVELARSGRGRKLSPRLRRFLASVDIQAWRRELKQLGLSNKEISDSARALARVQRDGLRAIFTHPRKTAPAELTAIGLRLFR